MKYFVSIIIFSLVFTSAIWAHPWDTAITYKEPAYNSGEVDLSGGPGLGGPGWKKWYWTTSGKSYAQVELDWNAIDDDASGSCSADSWWKKRWTWVGSPSDGYKCYRFDASISGKGYAYAKIDAQNLSSSTASGKAKCTVDCASMDSPVVDDKKQWAGAQITAEGGLKGIGVGETSASISWTSASGTIEDSDQVTPVASKIKDDPGSAAEIRIDTSAYASSYMDEGWDGKATGYGEKTAGSGSMTYIGP